MKLNEVSALIDFIVSILHLYRDIFITYYMRPTYIDIIRQDLLHLITGYNSYHGLINPINPIIDTHEISEIIDYALSFYHSIFIPERSSGNTYIRLIPNNEYIKNKIKGLDTFTYTKQRSAEWFDFRNNHLTASNVWKVFFSDSSRNQLIYEKCKSNNSMNVPQASGPVNLNTPMHWGNKYEPLSIKIYEDRYKTTIKEYGCIPHSKYHFIAASPDGINVCETSHRYGRMIEVKNIVNREITGIPKLEYWIQMQLQLEVCDLNECDFIETRFVEYLGYTEFIADRDKDTTNKCTDKDYKGLIMLFMTEDQSPHYVYAPLICNDYEKWSEAIMEENTATKREWVKNIYWKLETFSCVLVLRNKTWFRVSVPHIESLWNTITVEKITGCEHRAPQRRKQTTATKPFINSDIGVDDNILQGICLLSLE